MTKRRSASRTQRASISYHEGSARLARVAPADRPREKLARVGAEALGDNELLALVLGTGTRARNVIAIAQDVIEAAGGVPALVRLSLEELDAVPGVGTSRAARVLAAIELGRRTLAREADDRPQLLTPRHAAEYLMPRYAGFGVERFGVVLLDQKSRVIRTVIVSTGTLDASMAHPRDVFRAAALASAASVVAFHNHPSGDPLPSAEDRLVTRRLEQAGEVMGIELSDHIILGSGKYFSFKEESRR